MATSSLPGRTPLDASTSNVRTSQCEALSVLRCFRIHSIDIAVLDDEGSCVVDRQ